VVTGVSSGIGAATMHELVAAGYLVFGTVRRARDTHAVLAAGATPIIMDVTFRSSIVRAQETVARALGEHPLVGLVNNAGVPGIGPLEHADLDELRRTFEVNVIGVVAVTQLFLPLLRAAGGRIVNISSVSGRLALPFAGPYAASKFALEAISDSLRRELLGTGVEVIVIQPGSVRTAIWGKISTADLQATKGTVYGGLVEKVRQRAVQSGEQAMPAETVARAVLHALRVPRPPTRMLVVRRGAWKRRLLALIPDRWIDRIVARRLLKIAENREAGGGKREVDEL
jgi:NAD(P)-dependent dehydrogenase (short-subunit alcohol dehydrogenase family)